MNQPEAARRAFMAKNLSTLGIGKEDQHTLRRISMQLNRWHEHECNGLIARDDITGRCYAVSPSGIEYPTPDNKKPAHLNAWPRYKHTIQTLYSMYKVIHAARRCTCSVKTTYHLVCASTRYTETAWLSTKGR